MRLKKSITVLTLVLLAIALFIIVGCGGQQSREPEQTAKETTAPEQVPQEQSTIPEASKNASGEYAEPPAKKITVKPSEQAAPQVSESKPAAQAPSREAAPPAMPEEPAVQQEAVQSPPPEPIDVTVPAGTVLHIAFLDPLSSKTSQVGDAFRTEVKMDVVQDGWVAIPQGSIVTGTVTEAVSLKKIGGQAKLALDFSSLELGSGEVVPVKASFAEQGKSETGKDAATIGGATAGGALLGRVLGNKNKKKATIIGAVLGAAAGTVIAAKTEGQEVEIPAGSELTLQLTEPVALKIIP